MKYNNPNVYFNPEAFGLELIGAIEWREEYYEFDITIVLKKTRGEYYLASDSGCSCPSPFEDFTSVDKLLGPYDKKGVKFHLEEYLKEAQGVTYSTPARGLDIQVRNILDRIK